MPMYDGVWIAVILVMWGLAFWIMGIHSKGARVYRDTYSSWVDCTSFFGDI